MKRSLCASVLAVFVAAPIVWAEDDLDLRAAQRDLESARSHLEAAAHRTSGAHRAQALEHVTKALGDVREAMVGDTNVERHEERKGLRAQEREQRKETRAEEREERRERRDTGNAPSAAPPSGYVH